MSEQTDSGNALAALSDALADAVELAGRSVARVDGRHRQSASGIIWTADGLIVTADHVVERDEDLGVGLPDGRMVKARLVGRDPSSDLALLKIDETGLTPIQKSAAPRVGSLGLIVARPGSDLMASLGTVSAIGGPVRMRRGGRLEGIIAVDATYYPGFSGAPLVGANGGMLGLATSRLRGAGGAGFAIPPSAVEQAVTTLSAHGRVRRGFLGIGSQPIGLPEALRQAAGVGDQESGLVVITVEPNGPAEQAGVLLGDIVVALGGEAVRDPGELRDLLGSDRVGQQTALRVIRGGQSVGLTVTIGERQ